MSLHDDIMNLIADPMKYGYCNELASALRIGHRDARHAAAELALAADAEIARLSAQVEALRKDAWVPITDGLPAVGQTVLACYINRAGNVRRIRAYWIAAKTVEANIDDENADYDEATDQHWTPAGWYEQIDNWGDYSAVAVCEGEVTHWMPLPAAPAAKEQA